MSDFIKNPIKENGWHPSHGDYVSKSIMEEEHIHNKKERRKKTIISFLAITHIILLVSIILAY